MKSSHDNKFENQADKMTRYPLTGLLKGWMDKISSEPGGSDTIEAILQRVNDYAEQLRALKKLGGHAHVKAAINTLEKLHSQIPGEEKEKMSCQAGCTFCCYVDATITEDEAALIIEYCIKNDIEIDKDYLKAQLKKGRTEFSEVSKCVFLRDNLCTVYEVRPAVCRKHFVKSDPLLCDSSRIHDSNPDTVFDIQSEIVSSALYAVSEKGPIEQIILRELNRVE